MELFFHFYLLHKGHPFYSVWTSYIPILLIDAMSTIKRCLGMPKEVDSIPFLFFIFLSRIQKRENIKGNTEEDMN